MIRNESYQIKIKAMNILVPNMQIRLHAKRKPGRLGENHTCKVIVYYTTPIRVQLANMLLDTC